MVGAIDELERGALEPIPQGDIDASPAPKLKPEEAEIDWERSAGELANLVRALNPRPGAFTTAGGKRLIVWRARAVEGSGPSGTVLSAAPGLVVATGRGGLSLDEVQLEGKRPMPIEEFVRGRRFEAGRPLAGA